MSIFPFKSRGSAAALDVDLLADQAVCFEIIIMELLEYFPLFGNSKTGTF